MDPGAGTVQDVRYAARSLGKARAFTAMAVLDREIRLDGRPYTVIGVLPAGLTGAIGGFVLPAAAPDVWLPCRNSFSAEGIQVRGPTNVSAIGELRPGVSRHGGESSQCLYLDLDPSPARHADRPDGLASERVTDDIPARRGDKPAGAPDGKVPPNEQVVVEPSYLHRAQ